MTEMHQKKREMRARASRASAGHRVTGSTPHLVLLALCASLTLAGCATTSGGVPGSISRSVLAVASATQAASLAFEQNTRGASTDAVTGTALDDMLKDVSTEQTAVAALDPSDSETELRTQATALIRETVDAIDLARASLSSGTDSPAATAQRQGAREALSRAATDASALSGSLEQYR